MSVSSVRKFLVAAVPAVITVLAAAGVVVPEDVSIEVLALIDSVAAFLVWAIPNAN